MIQAVEDAYEKARDVASDRVETIEDFERENPLREYEGLVEWFDVTDEAYVGEHALLLDIPDDDDNPYAASVFRTEGLNIQRGEEVHVHFNNPEVNNFIGVHLMVQEGSVVEGDLEIPDGYTVGISAADECLKLWLHDDGELVEHACEYLPPAEQIDGWYRLEFSSDDSTVSFDLYDAETDDELVSIEEEEDTWSSGGIGFLGLGNGEMFDYVVYDEPTPVEEPTPTPTPTPTESPTPTVSPTLTESQPSTPESTFVPDTLSDVSFIPLGIGALLTFGGVVAWWRRSGGGSVTKTSESEAPSPPPEAGYEKVLDRGQSYEQWGDRYFENGNDEFAAAEYGNARDAYEEAISIADEHDLDADEAEGALARLEDQIRKTHCAELAEELDTFADRVSDAEENIRDGAYDDAEASLESALDDLDDLESRIESHDCTELVTDVVDLRDRCQAPLDVAETAHDITTDLERAENRLADASQYLDDGEHDSAAALCDEIPSTLDDVKQTAAEHELTAIQKDATDLGSRLDSLQSTIEATRNLRSALDGMTERVDDAEDLLADGEYREAGDRFETLLDDLSNLSDRADERAVTALRDEIESLRRRCQKGRKSTAEKLAEQAFGELEGRLDRASEQLDEVARNVETQPPTDLEAKLVDLVETLDEVEERASEFDETNLDDRIETVRRSVERQRKTLDAVEEIRDHVDDGHDRIDEALSLIDDAPDEVLDRIETVEDELSSLDERVRERDFETIPEEVGALRERCEYARERIEEAKRPGPPRSIPGAPDLDVSYQSLTRVELVGKGGNADVYLMETSNGEGLAVKEPRFTGTLHTETIERFIEEAETWNRLDDHEHVVGVVDYGDQPLPWIAMEYMDGGHLGERVDAVELREATWIALAISEALLHAHRRGVAHLDLKPANILFRTTEGDDWDVPKVADWGLAKMLLEHSKSIEGLTPQYAAPEQLDEESGNTDHATDIYQVGAVLYELFTGRPPFTGSTIQVVQQIATEPVMPPTEVDPDLPPKLDEILLTALAKDKDDRYEDLLYLRDDLRGLYESL